MSVGISDPDDRRRVLAGVAGRDLAVTTSGVAERGQHIVDPTTGLPPAGLASVSVVGRSLTLVDALATAVFARGTDALSWLEARPDVEGLAVADDGTVTRTTGFPSV